MAPPSAQVDRRRESGEPAADHRDPPAHAPAPVEAAGEHEPLLPRPQREPPAQDERRLGGDPLEQQPVLAGHREHAGGAAAVEQRHELEPPPEPAEPALGLEGDHELDRAAEAAADRLAAEALEVLGREVDAPGGGVLADVAEDVADLEGDAEVVGERGRRRARSEQSKTPSERRPIEPATQRQ